MPKSPRENSSGETVIGGRERGSDERYYRWLETGKLGWGKGGGAESEDWKGSHRTAQDAAPSERGWAEQLSRTLAMEAPARRQACLRSWQKRVYS